MTKNLCDYSADEIKREIERRKRGSVSTPTKKVLILLGPPGVGKATQCELIKKSYGFCHVATGELIRYHMQNQTRYGKNAKRYLTHGDLVPDYIVNDIVQETINKPECDKGIVFEGYPRNIQQADYLDNLLRRMKRTLDIVLEFNVEEDALLERLKGRIVQPTTGKSYHPKFNPPKVAMIDDDTGEPLIRRIDDDPPISHRKVGTYYKNLDSIVLYYSRKNLVKTIDAMNGINDIFKDISDHLH
jgi:adenylate kinase